MRVNFCHRNALSVIIGLAWCAPSLGANELVSLELNGRQWEGTPIAWSQQKVHLLSRDGQLVEFSPQDAKNYKKVGGAFAGYSAGEIRGQLLREFDKRFEVTGTGNYLVVHPVGAGKHWAQRFEDLYRSMLHYFTARGFSIERPQFPLIAIVFHNQSDFMRYSQSQGVQGIDSSVKGYYHHDSNRIYLFDSTGGNTKDPNWQQNASVLIHESAHQTAFNIGIHSRFGQTPVWVAEGIGTLFEAPGVYDSRNYRDQRDRINRYRLEGFRETLRGRSKDFLAQFVSSDRIFQIDWRIAYANAWALSFYLTERQPRELAAYLRKTAEVPDFQTYTSQQRLKDFTDVFGENLTMLDAKLVRFIETLPQKN